MLKKKKIVKKIIIKFRRNPKKRRRNFKYYRTLKLIALMLLSSIIGIYQIKKNLYKLYDNNDDNNYNAEKVDYIAEKIYNKTGKLSFNELEKKINKTIISYSKFNNVHIAMSFNNDYYLLTTVTIVSILKTAAPDTYIHIHIIEAGDFVHETRKKLNSLKAKINNNSEFVFYDGTQAIKDFGRHIITEHYGVGEYARLMAPDLINTDRVIVIDSGDIFVQKDLVELYNTPFNNSLLYGIVDPFAHCFSDEKLNAKEKYINGGVLLFNSKKWREMGIYKDIVNFYKAFKFEGRLGLPIQQILNFFLPFISVGVLPLRYNFQYHPYISASCVGVTKEEIEDAKKNEVIRHNNKLKPNNGEGEQAKWYYYANLTGFVDELCAKFPRGCRK